MAEGGLGKEPTKKKLNIYLFCHAVVKVQQFPRFSSIDLQSTCISRAGTLSQEATVQSSAWVSSSRSLDDPEI